MNAHQAQFSWYRSGIAAKLRKCYSSSLLLRLDQQENSRVNFGTCTPSLGRYERTIAVPDSPRKGDVTENSSPPEKKVKSMPAAVNMDIRKALTAYLRASAHLADILAKEQPASLGEPDPGRGKRRTDWATDLPCLASVAGEKSDPHCVSTRMKSHEAVRVYIAGCEGLKALSREFSLPLYKIGTTQGDLLQRLAELDADQYAANYRHGKKMVTEPGFNRWSLTTLDFNLPKSPTVRSGSSLAPLRLRLPGTLAPDAFERLLRDALAGISLATWLKTAEGQRHFAELGSIWSGRIATRLTPMAQNRVSRRRRRFMSFAAQTCRGFVRLWNPSLRPTDGVR